MSQPVGNPGVPVPCFQRRPLEIPGSVCGSRESRALRCSLCQCTDWRFLPWEYTGVSWLFLLLDVVPKDLQDTSLEAGQVWVSCSLRDAPGYLWEPWTLPKVCVRTWNTHASGGQSIAGGWLLPHQFQNYMINDVMIMLVQSTRHMCSKASPYCPSGA